MHSTADPHHLMRSTADPHHPMHGTADLHHPMHSIADPHLPAHSTADLHHPMRSIADLHHPVHSTADRRSTGIRQPAVRPADPHSVQPVPVRYGAVQQAHAAPRVREQHADKADAHRSHGSVC